MIIYLIYILTILSENPVFALPSSLSASPSSPHHYQTQIYKSPSNSYFIYLHIGTPLLKRSFKLDTSTHSISLNCQFCPSCSLPLPLSTPNPTNLSSTLTPITCSDNSPYCSNCNTQQSPQTTECRFQSHSNNNENMLIGYVVKDFVFMSENNTVSFDETTKVVSPMQCVTGSTWEIGEDGVIGLAPESFRDLYESIYYRKGEGSGKKEFALCFSRTGGMFYLGKVGDDGNGEEEEEGRGVNLEYQYSEGYYQMSFSDLSVGGIKFNLNKNPDPPSVPTPLTLSLSTNTHTTVIPSLYYTRLTTILQQVCNSIPSCRSVSKSSMNCYRLPSNQATNRFPNISILTTEGQRLEWNPADYLTKRESMLYCLDIKRGERMVLGVSWMLHKMITFDVENQILRVRDSNCGEEGYERGGGYEEGEGIEDMILGLPFETLVLCIVLMMLVGVIIGILFKKYWKRGGERVGDRERGQKRSIVYMESDVRDSKPAVNLVEEENVEEIELEASQNQNPTESIIA